LSSDEIALVAQTNAERKKRGLGRLEPSPLLLKAARDHTTRMAARDVLAHELDGKGPEERLADVGYRHAGWGENVAMGQRSAGEAIATWMDSPGHRANLLNPDFRQIGVGIATNARGQRYFTQVFGIPR
jgi:uncharacterized protein YkwD